MTTEDDFPWMLNPDWAEMLVIKHGLRSGHNAKGRDAYKSFMNSPQIHLETFT
jgi:hypothetical protein